MAQTRRNKNMCSTKAQLMGSSSTGTRFPSSFLSNPTSAIRLFWLPLGFGVFGLGSVTPHGVGAWLVQPGVEDPWFPQGNVGHKHGRTTSKKGQQPVISNKKGREG